MAASAEYAPPKELVNVMVQSSEKLEGAASLLEMLEDKADNQRITASELAAVRCIVETCASDSRCGIKLNLILSSAAFLVFLTTAAWT